MAILAISADARIIGKGDIGGGEMIILHPGALRAEGSDAQSADMVRRIKRTGTGDTPMHSGLCRSTDGSIEYKIRGQESHRCARV